jgi:hypothetical protein
MVVAYSIGHTSLLKSEELHLLDEIRAIVLTYEGTELVTLSDLERPNFFGTVPTLREEIQERLLYQDALKHRIIISEDQIDRQIAAVMQQNNLTLDELKAVCTEYGMMYQELRDKLARSYSIATMQDHVIESRMIINRSDIEAYCEAHPEQRDAIYYLQRAIIPFASDRNAQRDALLARLVSHASSDDIAWSVVFSVGNADIADDKNFIRTMRTGDVVMAEERSDGFELYRLVDKMEAHMRTLEERYFEVDELLRRALREELLYDYHNKLLNEAIIVSPE